MYVCAALVFVEPLPPKESLSATPLGISRRQDTPIGRLPLHPRYVQIRCHRPPIAHLMDRKRS